MKEFNSLGIAPLMVQVRDGRVIIVNGNGTFYIDPIPLFMVCVECDSEGIEHFWDKIRQRQTPPFDIFQ
jgi:hypothetical protein